MHGGSAGCPMASATSSVTLWLCSAGHPVHEWAILCPSEVVMHNRWCCLQSVNVHFHRIHPWCVDVKARRRRTKTAACRTCFVYIGPHPTSGCRWCHATTAKCASPILRTASQFTYPDSPPNCRRWKWWCWGSRRHNEMLQCSGRGVVDVTGNWLGFAYRQDATQAGVYIIFNDVK